MKKFTKTAYALAICLIFLLCSIFVSGCSSSNREYVRDRAAVKWEKQGFEVVDYEGWHFCSGIPMTPWGGACVWHRLKKIPDNGITYSGYIKRWGDELHVYGPSAADAIKPN